MASLSNTIQLLEEFLTDPQLEGMREDVFGGDCDLLETMMLEQYFGFSVADLSVVDRMALCAGLVEAVRILCNQIFLAIGDAIGTVGYSDFFKPLIEILPRGPWAAYLTRKQLKDAAVWLMRSDGTFPKTLTPIDAISCAWVLLHGSTYLPAVQMSGFNLDKALQAVDA